MSDLDALIRRIKEGSLPSTQASAEVASVAFTASRSEDMSAPACITSSLVSLVRPEEVIGRYYQWVLRRVVDPHGQAVYEEALAQGMPAWAMLFNLRYSAEGRAAAVPLQGFYGARFLWACARLTRPVRCHRLFWYGLQRLSEAARARALKKLMLPVPAAESLSADLEQLRLRLHQITQSYAHLSEELQEARMTLEKNSAQLQVVQALLQAKQHQQLLQVDAKTLEKPAALPVDVQAALDAYYLAFEDAHRGPSAEIQAGLNDYETMIEQLPAGSEPALDLGCGRGEWLLWLQERSIAATGVDGNPVMVEHCQQRGLTVIHADLLSHLQSLPSHSQRLVTSFHVIEHLPFDVLFVMLREIHRVLVPGAWMILETPNPENVLVGSHTFYHDFSHKAPITPTSIEFLAQYQGFVSTRILRRNPYPESARVIGSDPLTERLNGHLCGPQDFALIAQTPLVS